MNNSAKKPLAFLLSMLLMLPLLPVAAAADSSDYIDIGSAADLDAIRLDLDGKYRLTADITFSPADFEEGGAFYNNGNGWNPIGETYGSDMFSGEFDGNGHTISGLTITKQVSARSTYAGLFGVAGGLIHDVTLKDFAITLTPGEYVYAGTLTAIGTGTIKNITVVNSSITVEDASITAKVGGIAGRMFSGSVFNSKASGQMDVTGVLLNCGGIVGQNHATISSVVCDTDITATSRGDAHIGGISGYNEDPISTSVYRGDMVVSAQADGYVGGIVGTNLNTLSDSLFIGTQTRHIKSHDNYGGIVADSTGPIQSCYYLNTSCQDSPSVTGVSALTNAQLSDQTAYTGWDFDKDWSIGLVEGVTYPIPQSFVRAEQLEQLLALIQPIDDPIRYTAASIRVLMNAQNRVLALTTDNTLSEMATAKAALLDAQSGLAPKRLSCNTVGQGNVEIVGDNAYGNTVTLTASPKEEQILSGMAINGLFYSQGSLEVTVTGNENATAYFRDQNECTLVFCGRYGRVVEVQTVTSTEELVAPTPPQLKGYDFVGWDTDLTALDLTAGCIFVDAVYTAKDEPVYSVTLTDAVADVSTDEPLLFDTCLKLTPAKKEGATFSYWLVNGKAASTNEIYYLYVAGNDEVKAVFSDTSTAKPGPTVSLQSADLVMQSNGAYRWNVISQTYLPADCQLVEYGVVFASDPRCEEEPSIMTVNSTDCATITVSASSKQPNRRYLIYLSDVRPGVTRFARSYMVYKLADGQYSVLYSPISRVDVPNV